MGVYGRARVRVHAAYLKNARVRAGARRISKKCVRTRFYVTCESACHHQITVTINEATYVLCLPHKCPLHAWMWTFLLADKIVGIVTTSSVVSKLYGIVAMAPGAMSKLLAL